MTADTKREQFCYFLANVYIACNKTQYKFKCAIPNRIDEIITEWISLKNVQEISLVKKAKLNCVYDFLSKCLEEFKCFHFDTFDFILDKAIEHNRDFAANRFVYLENFKTFN